LGRNWKAITAIFRYDYTRVCVFVEIQFFDIWRGGKLHKPHIRYIF